MRIFLKFLTVIFFLGAITWLYSDRSFEPFLTTITALISVITAFFLPKKKSSIESPNNDEKTLINNPSVVYKKKSTHNGDNNF